MSTIENLL